VSITEELLGRNSSGSGQENREYYRGDPLRRPRNTLYPQTLARIRRKGTKISYPKVAVNINANLLCCISSSPFFASYEGADRDPGPCLTKASYCINLQLERTVRVRASCKLREIRLALWDKNAKEEVGRPGGWKICG
jgi:hypothetical protein